MSLGQPIWFWAFLLFPVLIGIFLRNERLRGKLLRQLVAARLENRLAGSVSVPLRRLRFLFLILGLAGLIVSLAHPRYGYVWEQSHRKGRDVLIAIDCSRSMLATDLAPNRLGRAKLAAQDFIGQLSGDRVGLIAFAGTAFLQAPLTIDYGAVLNSLQELDTDIIPRGGTDIAAAIKEATDAFGKGESDNRCLVIFTDGEELDADGVAAAEAVKDKVKIFTVGLGSADGSLIPIPAETGGTTFVKDESGQIVKSRLDEPRLTKIAESTGGFYVHLQNGPAEMKQIAQSGLGQMKEEEIDARLSRRPIERYQWSLAASLLFLVASMLVGERKRGERWRRATIVASAVLLGMIWNTPAQAEWKNPGVEKYQRGTEAEKKWIEAEKGSTDAEAARAAAQKQYEESLKEFSHELRLQPDSPALNFNLGAAAYKLGNNDDALLAFSKATLTKDPQLRVDAESNIGSTLYRKGEDRLRPGPEKKPGEEPKPEVKKETLRDWKDGLQHYDEALRVQPENKTVQAYRDFLQRKIDELEKEPPKSDQQKQQDQKDQKQDDKDQDKKDQQQQQSQGGQQKKDQKGDQKDQKQQGQQQQQSQGGQKDQQQQQGGSGSDSKQDQQSQKQEGKDGKDGQQGKDGKDQQEKNDPKDGKDGQQQQQPSGGQNGDKKDQKSDPSQNGQDGPPPQVGQNQNQPAPSPDQPDKKLSGDIKSQGSASPSPQNDPQQEAAAEARAAQEGKMTEAQAKNLLDSLKGEDERVQLLNPGERRQVSRSFHNW